MHNRFFVFMALYFVSLFAQAQMGGTRIYPFLEVPIAPRVAGAAGAVIANTEDDVNFAFWNPALINPEMHGNMSLSFTTLTGGVNFGEAAYSHTFAKAGSFFAGVKYVDYGEFLRTNPQAQVLGTFTATDYSFQFGYGYQLDSNWQFGANLKFINAAYANYSSWALAADVAAVYQLPKKRTAFTFVMRNMGTQLATFDGQKEPLPFQMALGFSTRLEHVPLRFNLSFENLQQWDLTYNDPNNVTTDPITGETVVVDESWANNLMRHVLVAAELAPSKNFNIQLGYNFRRGYEMEVPTRRSSAGLTLGIGLRISKFRINYANTNMNVSGRMHHFGITTALDNFRRKPEPAQ
jgi:hypothetical protein